MNAANNDHSYLMQQYDATYDAMMAEIQKADQLALKSISPGATEQDVDLYQKQRLVMLDKIQEHNAVRRSMRSAGLFG